MTSRPVGAPTRPRPKSLRLPSPGDLTKLLSIHQESDPKKPQRMILCFRDDKKEVVARLWEMSDVRKLWAMCQEIMTGRLEEGTVEPTQDCITHLDLCSKGCGNWIKWREWYPVASGPDPKNVKKFKRCCVCAEGWIRGRRALTMLRGGRA